jgi:linoleoyl-CoA desaturase
MLKAQNHIEGRVELSASANTVEQPAVRRLRFTGQRDFRKTLNERVNAYLHENHIPARDVPAMYVKTAVSLVWWLGTYLLLLLGHFPTPVNVVLCVVWGMAIAAVGFNVMHDANHGGYSDHPRINKLVSLSAEILGMSGFRWRTKHNVWHHTYTNIAGYDDDVEAFGLMRLTPREPWKPLYMAQAWYFPVIYSFIAIDFIIRDFMMVLAGKSDANHVYPKLSATDKVTFWAGKLFYFGLMFALPLLVFPWWQVILGFLIVMLTVGLILGVVFQLAHISRAAEFPEPVGSPPHIENEWAMHQIETTVDFAPRNRLLNWYIGGLNYQVEHHLLPHICHLNYPRLAPIVAATCEEFGIRYNCYPTWREAFVSHWRELRLLGRAAEPARG